MTDARLHIFKGPRALAELQRGKRVEWSAARTSTCGEIAFFYHAAPTSAIVAVGRALEDPRPDRTWKYLAWFDRVMLEVPLPLRELRADPVAGRWSVWRMLSRTTVRVPPVTASAAARLILARDPRLGRWLDPFLEVFPELREAPAQ